MENLLINSQNKIHNVSLEFRRYLLSDINWCNRLIALKGARGTGKTTLLLQYASLNLANDHRVLYVAMDDLFFYKNNLYNLADHFVKNDGKFLLLDEVHKYPDWSREIKLIYDNFPELKVVFTFSSILEIYKSESDLSRRAVSYFLKELSLREFIEFQSGIKIQSYTLNEIVQNHRDIVIKINEKLRPLFEFNKYLKYGSYPYFKEDKENYYQKLRQTINLILDIDLPAVVQIDYNHIVKIKRLLYVVATSVPFTPNISKLSEKIGISRPGLIKALDYLEKAQLVNQLVKNTQGVSLLSKPDKLYLNNTNLIFSLAKENANIGNLRETFFVNQLRNKHEVNLAEKGDFVVDDNYVFEVGRKNKTQKQIKNLKNAFIIKDDIEFGINNIIPLWLFGFLY